MLISAPESVVSVPALAFQLAVAPRSISVVLSRALSRRLSAKPRSLALALQQLRRGLHLIAHPADDIVDADHALQPTEPIDDRHAADRVRVHLVDDRFDVIVLGR